MSQFKKTIVIALGGSLVFPDEIDVQFLIKFKLLIEGFLKQKYRFILVTGGGKICRKYNDAVKKLNPQAIDKELDWMGIKSTKVNAELVRIMFGTNAYYKVLDSPDEKLRKQFNRPIILSGGWKPGRSTDYVAVALAQNFKAQEVIIMTNVDYVYTADPKKDPQAQPIKELNWSQYRKMFGVKWVPGLNIPVDPQASKLAQKNRQKVVYIKGSNLANFKDYLSGSKFIGTVIF